MGRANAGLDLMWDLAYAFEVEDRVFDGKSGAAATIAWTQHCVADNDRGVVVNDLGSRYAHVGYFCLVFWRLLTAVVSLTGWSSVK